MMSEVKEYSDKDRMPLRESRVLNGLLEFQEARESRVFNGLLKVLLPCFFESRSPLSISVFSFQLTFNMADDEVVDPKKYLEESCKPKCVKPLLEYQACVKRIQSDDSGHKHCTGQYFDYWQCIDKCFDTEMKLDFGSSGCTKAVCETKMKRGEAGDSIVLSLLHVV
ncbi:putative cytochrome b-c1 complex, subunit 6, ubiquinol-cytochrome C reductase hinge [Arabidopsis thaliana]|uniref:Complex III subunit VI n=1 Tax=Arabidopsis thaliana TaxID=3702 RepID=A0A5S9UK37_ARATH|nr:unnamed protein product [Arabidopsis thaliana]